MTTVIAIAIVMITLSALPAAYRMLVGPTRSDRVSAADFLLFVLVALLGLSGFLKGSGYTFDLMLVASLVGFLSAVSLSRALLRGAR
ncbi:monovalent cation/H+ antiporter complex subunit F [Corynebacterium pseudodiphtheriticum]|uniref:monovalent cation/H+ antiporter complex subunit F n=1 Tax=Corynebacterium pseudodiphtheriticum TaxID=37637 RepID=UPI002542C65F|nr:monovalent cation/H+ antiporter complex subunit F [Corynebacterium pseudodiphtheriticum]MDK4297401.1 monovalent cation/H+ antiporter complex subunit F [Corynebacterium pseudodiphtheriticum]